MNKKRPKHLRTSVHTCVSGNLLVATVFCRYCEYVALLGCVTALLPVFHPVFQTMLQGGKLHARLLKPYAFLFFFYWFMHVQCYAEVRTLVRAEWNVCRGLRILFSLYLSRFLLFSEIFLLFCFLWNRSINVIVVNTALWGVYGRQNRRICRCFCILAACPACRNTRLLS